MNKNIQIKITQQRIVTYALRPFVFEENDYLIIGVSDVNLKLEFWVRKSDPERLFGAAQGGLWGGGILHFRKRSLKRWPGSIAQKKLFF